MLGLTQRGLIGIVLMIVGTAAFYPTLFPGTTLSVDLTAVAAAALLTLGTYLVGTDMDGRPV
ncbi:hypothetical protein DU500_16285 [Haloplanus rubicundus]|jgi:hypothetical protein|uniref:Uncharacterized protein n=1 Tax=Haloplanus rubicundus TaxID=1547898 RepID=A0A345E6N8_9EURY|nr:hypothetical protein [Haloplanus rubicundus]AXG07860.1 hypothetical protein DU500_16285 [Haloplanus rubicundus]AXG11275.1 hypothetical protein DU484_16245 [Haloplanus rubicundus]